MVIKRIKYAELRMIYAGRFENPLKSRNLAI